MEYQDKLSSLVDGCEISNILIMGHYNTDINKDSSFPSDILCWENIVAEYELIVLDNTFSDQNSFI